MPLSHWTERVFRLAEQKGEGVLPPSPVTLFSFVRLVYALRFFPLANTPSMVTALRIINRYQTLNSA